MLPSMLIKVLCDWDTLPAYIKQSKQKPNSAKRVGMLKVENLRSYQEPLEREILVTQITKETIKKGALSLKIYTVSNNIHKIKNRLYWNGWNKWHVINSRRKDKNTTTSYLDYQSTALHNQPLHYKNLEFSLDMASLNSFICCFDSD